jgi:hypothetical protein
MNRPHRSRDFSEPVFDEGVRMWVYDESFVKGNKAFVISSATGLANFSLSRTITLETPGNEKISLKKLEPF